MTINYKYQVMDLRRNFQIHMEILVTIRRKSWKRVHGLLSFWLVFFMVGCEKLHGMDVERSGGRADGRTTCLLLTKAGRGNERDSSV